MLMTQEFERHLHGITRGESSMALPVLGLSGRMDRGYQDGTGWLTDGVSTQIENPISPTHVKKDLYIDNALLTEATKNWEMGTRVRVHRQYFHGTQPMEDYQVSSRRNVEEKLREKGISYLEDEPIVTVAIPTVEQSAYGIVHSTRLAIADGHHRFRYSGNGYGITELPTIVFTLQEYAALYNIGKDPSDKITVESLYAVFTDRMAEALDSFAPGLCAKRKQDMQPKPVLGVTSVDQLKMALTKE